MVANGNSLQGVGNALRPAGVDIYKFAIRLICAVATHFFFL